MNIAIFTNNYLPNPYGVTTSIESFRLQFEKMGHKVYVFAPHAKGYEDKNKNVFRFPSIDLKYRISFPLGIPYSFKIRRILKKLEIDIIHSQHPNLLGSAAMKLARKKNIPIVFTWHTLYDKYANYVPLLPESWTSGWAIRSAVSYSNQCDHVIVPTESVKELIWKWGVTNEKITSIVTGVDEVNFQNPDGEKIRKKHGIKKDEVVIFSASRFATEKNIIFLLKEVIKSLRRNEKTKFILGGEGYLRERIEKIISKNNLQERIILPGLISRAEMKDYFDAADIFVYASKSETQGSILSEAMYMGLPTVAVDSTGSRDLVENGKSGILTSSERDDFSRALDKLLTDEKMRESLRKEARKIAHENYTDKICAKKMIGVYEGLIGR